MFEICPDPAPCPVWCSASCARPRRSLPGRPDFHVLGRHVIGKVEPRSPNALDIPQRLCPARIILRPRGRLTPRGARNPSAFSAAFPASCPSTRQARRRHRPVAGARGASSPAQHPARAGNILLSASQTGRAPMVAGQMHRRGFQPPDMARQSVISVVGPAARAIRDLAQALPPLGADDLPASIRR